MRLARTIRWSEHALDALGERRIDEQQAKLTLQLPEFIVIQPQRRTILMRRYFDAILNKTMLMRVVVEDTSSERIVVTVYKTSRMEKYLKGFPQ